MLPAEWHCCRLPWDEQDVSDEELRRLVRKDGKDGLSFSTFSVAVPSLC
jgi:hypothetical protein